MPKRFSKSGASACVAPCATTINRGTLEISGANLMYEGARVKSWILGRDVNPAGRGDGAYYAQGAFSIGSVRPSPTTTPVGGWGNSVNNGCGGGCGNPPNFGLVDALLDSSIPWGPPPPPPHARDHYTECPNILALAHPGCCWLVIADYGPFWPSRYDCPPHSRFECVYMRISPVTENYCWICGCFLKGPRPPLPLPPPAGPTPIPPGSSPPDNGSGNGGSTWPNDPNRNRSFLEILRSLALCVARCMSRGSWDNPKEKLAKCLWNCGRDDLAEEVCDRAPELGVSKECCLAMYEYYKCLWAVVDIKDIFSFCKAAIDCIDSIGDIGEHCLPEEAGDLPREWEALKEWCERLGRVPRPPF